MRSQVIGTRAKEQGVTDAELQIRHWVLGKGINIWMASAIADRMSHELGCRAKDRSPESREDISRRRQDHLQLARRL